MLRHVKLVIKLNVLLIQSLTAVLLLTNFGKLFKYYRKTGLFWTLQVYRRVLLLTVMQVSVQKYHNLLLHMLLQPVGKSWA